LAPIATAQEAELLAERLRRAVGGRYELEAGTVEITASIGLTVTRDRSLCSEQIIAEAHLAMCVAKDQGGNVTRAFDDALRAPGVWRQEIERELTGAIEEDRIEVWLEPILQCVDGSIEAVQVLLRVRAEDDAVILADEFIDHASTTGSIVPIGVHGLTLALDGLERLDNQLGTNAPRRLELNVCASELRDGGRIDVFIAELAGAGFDTSRLSVVLSEPTMSLAGRSVRQAIARIRGAGVAVVLGEIGTDGIPVGAMQRLPISAVKLHPNLVAALETDDHSCRIAAQIIATAHDLAMPVTAVGVDHEYQRELLIKMGCDKLQGSAIGPAMTAEGLVHWSRLLRS
ncbi:MAG: EAL domain-containing protein, partial [Solirubrobacteraceae bacterium]